MTSDLTSKLAAAGLELSKANEEKLDLVFDMAMSQLQDEMRSQTDDELQFARNKLNAAELERSNIAAISLKSFENALESCKKSVEQAKIQNQTSISNVEQAVQEFTATTSRVSTRLDMDIRIQTRMMEEKSKELIEQFEVVKKHYRELKHRHWLVMGGMVIGALLVLFFTTSMAVVATQRATEATRRATEATRRATEAQESTLEAQKSMMEAQENLKSTNDALEVFHKTYGLRVRLSKKWGPMFILDEGRVLTPTPIYAENSKIINGWMVK